MVQELIEQEKCRMPFDLRPLVRALIALWTVVQVVSGYRGNPLHDAFGVFGLWTVLGIFFAAGLSETFGTRAVTLFLNRVGRRPFVISLLLTALTYIVGGVVWAITIDVVLDIVFARSTPPLSVVIKAVAIGYLPLLFAFLAFIPYLGPAILLLLQGLSLLLTTLAVAVGFGLPVAQAAICTTGGWLIVQLLRWFTAGPTTLISHWVLRRVTGREVSYQLRDIVPAAPGRLNVRRRSEDGTS